MVFIAHTVVWLITSDVDELEILSCRTRRRLGMATGLYLQDTAG